MLAMGREMRLIWPAFQGHDAPPAISVETPGPDWQSAEETLTEHARLLEWEDGPAHGRWEDAG